MRKKNRLILSLIFIFLVIPGSIFAQQVSLNNPLAPPGGANPTLLDLIGFAARILMGFVGSLSLLFVILGGYRLLVSRGNAEEVKKGQQTITWAIIGVVLSLLSYAIISLVIRTLSS